MAQFREQLGIRIPHKHARIRRGKSFRRVLSPPIVAVVFLFLVVTLFAFWLLSSDRDIQERFDDVYEDDEEGLDIQSPFNKSMPDRKLRFGRGLGTGGRDSRYWDKDDRRRDDEYDEDSLDISRGSKDDESVIKNHHKGKVGQGSGEEKFHEGRGLYDEAGRNELKQFEERYKESLNNAELSAEQDKGGEDANPAGDYDDSIDIDDDMNKPEDLEHEEHHMHEGIDADRTVNNPGDLDHEEYNTHEGRIRKSRLWTEIGVVNNSETNPFESIASSVFLKSSGNAKLEHEEESGGASIRKASISKHKPSVKVKTRRRSSCAMKLLNSTKLFEPPDNRKFLRFALQYKEVEDRPDGVDEWKPHFAGHQSLQEREESFYARDQKINCGFVKGPEGTQSTGFDLAEDDVRFMSSCHIAVSSCIFGNSDRLRTPYAKVISRPSRKSVCFVMFVDEKTLQTLSYEGRQPDSMGFIGLWKIVLVKNMPYDDMRRVGKIPKFLAHRLFPSARYSIWLDSKLRLQSDPVVILEYFLWRKGYEYAISNHYDRHCLWDEVLQNKRLNKYNHTIIDEQFAFYQADGLKRFDPSDPDRLLPSYVPEGSFILRAHTPMSNLFSCLWFNEVERFTPRDQLSFAYTYLKLRRMNPEKPFHLHMFKDCERRAIAKLFRHRGVSKRRVPVQVVE